MILTKPLCIEIAVNDLDHNTKNNTWHRWYSEKYACQHIEKKDFSWHCDIIDGKAMVIFTTVLNLRTFCSMETVLMDGTFKACSKPFEQLYTIVGYENGINIPLVFALLMDKSCDTYTKLFQILTDKCEQLELTLYPEITLTEDLMCDIPSGTKFSQFADYVLETYVSEECIIEPSIWAHSPDSDPQTTNGAESYHSHLSEQFYTAHPNIYVFVEILLRRQTAN